MWSIDQLFQLILNSSTLFLKRDLWSATYVDNTYVTYKLTLAIHQLVYISWGPIHIIRIPPLMHATRNAQNQYIYKYTHVPIAISNNELYQSISHLNNAPSVSNHLSFTHLCDNLYPYTNVKYWVVCYLSFSFGSLACQVS